MPAILFICTGNQFRSPIAAAYFSKKVNSSISERTWTICSAGIWTSAGLPAHPEAIKAAAKIGLDLTTHRTQEVNARLLARHFDLIVVMEQNHKEVLELEFPSTYGRVVLLGHLAHFPGEEIQDPAKNRFISPDLTTHEICSCIDKGLRKLIELAIFLDEGIPLSH